mmetsp:Transcript_46532/g.77327  ORF Transcript_46532/g.77327 Transcript_46532/m.77327 type:complete len:185 (-) Transcript_46532:197-751(-)|eukprot:CAMPEP_0202706092 /NCGR_PEP_ID=MMETSP1385-20130828/18571_1 /ASSEMBLY_ACC=CAM_ASM_000861 /TAXON_ID=933848 /ORGANISM="Elphidium margaritaceum" /LENGTH=184 /DNA_ID=CAMNT_0049364483 /DNA_START=59 /DNA_END=613 /DNA_ORIENTATION=+
MPPCANNFIFNVLDFVIGLMLFIVGCVSFAGTFVQIVIPLYQCFFGLCIMIATLIIPEILFLMIPFYMNFMGRGLTFLFLGCLAVTAGQRGWNIAAAVITIAVAFVYIVLWFLARCGVFACSLPPPCIRSVRDDRDSNDNAPNAVSKKRQTKDDAPQDVPAQSPPQQHDTENQADAAVYGGDEV